jgi:hypothetical protein
MSTAEYIGAEDLSPAARKALGHIKRVDELTKHDLATSEDMVLAILEPLSDEDYQAVLEVCRRHGELLRRQGYVYLAEECSPDDLEPSDFE